MGPASVARGAGVNLGAVVSRDLEQQARPPGGLVTIGAYEGTGEGSPGAGRLPAPSNVRMTPKP